MHQFLPVWTNEPLRNDDDDDDEMYKNSLKLTGSLKTCDINNLN